MAWLENRSRSELGLSLGVLVLGIAISAAGAFRLHQEIDARASENFERGMGRVLDDIELRFTRAIFGLKGARGMYAANDTISRDQFRAYVQARDLKLEFPGVRGFGLIQRVLRKDLDAMVAAERADGAPRFAIRQLDNKDLDDLYVIRFLEPGERNNGALGLDIGSEQVRRRGAERAIAAGEPTLTENITLVQDNKHSSGALLYVPLYRNGQQPANAEQRRDALLGLLFAPIVLSELLDGIHDVKVGQLEFSLFDTANMAQPVYVARHDTRDAQQRAAAGTPRFQASKTVTISDRQMTLQLSSTPAFDAEINHLPSWLLLLGGSLVSALLSLLLWQQTSGRRRAEMLAHGMTRDLERLAQVVRHTSNAVSIQDQDMNIVWINEGFTRITGYAAADAIGKTPGALMSSGKAPPEVLQTLADSARNGTACRVEILNRARDGHEFWIDTEVQPLRDTTGALTGFMEIGNDVTASKIAEQTLAHERSTLANIIEGTNAGTWEWNAATGHLRVNAQWAQIAGFTLDDLDFTRIETWRSLMHPDDRARSQQLMQQHFDGKTPGYECENRIRHKDGHWLWVLGKAKLISRDTDGAPLWVAGIQLDINNRKQAEFALRENESLMRLVIENMGGRLAYFDAFSRLQFANQATYDFFGGSAGDRIGCTFEELLGPERVARMGPAVERVLAGEKQSYESEITQHDGQKTYSVVHLVPDMRDDATHGFVALAVDVTLAKRAEVEARRADRLMRTAIDATDAAFVLFDPDDRLVFCNERYRELYGASADLIVPGAAFADLIREGARRGQYQQAVGRIDAWVAERLDAHKRDSSELVQQLDDGRSLRVVERRLPDGHTVGLRIDITEQVNATEAAQAGSRAKSQFLANMSHEIRTPMNAILGLLALLRKTHLDVRQADYTVKTEKAARSLLSLLNDILDISKVESGKLALDPHVFGIDQLLRDLAVILGANLGDKPVEVLFDIDPLLPVLVEGDMLRLQQVLINLAGNAVKFTEQGEVVIAVKVASQDADAVTLAFAVRDTGIGVAAENQKHIFSGFSQAEASTTRRFGGTGLGLAISSRLVEMMGGTLELESELGKGSLFHFAITLPVPAQPADATAAPSEHRRALVVDDNATARVLLQEIGASLGWMVDVAHDAEQALDMIQQATITGQSWEIVLMDWQMPGMDGWQACQRIRDMQADRATLILMVSAHDLETQAKRSLQGPEIFDGFLVKPVTASMVYDAVCAARTGHNVEAPRAVPAPSRRRLAGVRLLVAEDNATNQMVARELLEAEGATVEIVADGAAAVRAVADARSVFDAVLMDLQMPVMDGFTATGLIRGELGLIGLPIIAMTANAMASDREACLAAGMNDHVGKPFEIDHLVDVVRKHCVGQAAGVATNAATSIAQTMAGIPAVVANAAAAAGIDIDAALRRLSGNQRIYHQLMRGVLADLDAAPDRLRATATAGDGRAAIMLLHTLRGQVATLGADALAGDLAACEKQLGGLTQPAGMQSVIAPALSAIAAGQSGHHALLRALDDAQPVRADSADDAADTTRLREDLASLALQLRSADMAATDTIAAMRQRFDTVTLAQLQPLEDAVNALEFDAALRLCTDWLQTHPA